MTANTTSNMHGGNEIGKQIEYLARVLKTPTIRRMWAELADRARAETWSHEQYLAAVLERQVNEREANGTVMRIAGARFPATKTLEDFTFDHVPTLPRDTIAHLATSTWIAKGDNVILLGPPGVGKTHLGIALGIKAAQCGYPVLFDTATGWAARLTDAHNTGRLPQELKRLRRYRLLIVDEIGYLPFDTDTANLFFQLIASRYEQGSILITSNMPFDRWGEVFADEIGAAALIDRLVHHAEVITINGDSYRTKTRRELVKTNK